MVLIAFIVARAVVVLILNHLGESSRAPRMAPIRGPPGDGEMCDGQDPGDCHPVARDPPVDGMPDDENQSQELIW